MSEFNAVWEQYSQRTEQSLTDRLLDRSVVPNTLHHAMQYVCLNGGKRFRAMLVYACGELAGVERDRLDTPASAVEMVHAYSLTHDDLPAMDNDSLRRGRPTCHVAFDEATAILAGDALQSRAFEILASSRWNPIAPECRARMLEELAQAIGSSGMAGGQALDMEATDSRIDYQALVHLHSLKTGALIRAAAVLGCLAADPVDEALLAVVAEYASAIGLSFQIMDDVLDQTSNSATVGKKAGADKALGKSTYVSLIGVDAARQEAEKLSRQAIESIQGLGDNIEFLEQLANFVVSRKY